LWLPALLDEGRTWHDTAGTGAVAERICRAFLDRMAPAIAQPRTQFLTLRR
jgi:hypothetical protein